ncbi:NAD(P)-binding protein [Artomyces pyxidatus]|uniref:NAD(P)-binding protein n=1 Tax=Artomyces pyxidatus TaxID=48021 RepID=A0ACB8SKP0_9AGAM|nr:NAD(P)-binding protein [Artomyces pyxidatus]
MADPNAKVWLITGASSGLGLALLMRAVSRGDYVLASARDPSRFDPIFSTLCTGQRARVHVLHLNVASPFSEIKEAVDGAVRVWGRIDCLVNNAGIGAVGASEEQGAEGMLHVMHTNFFGVLNVTNATLPHMRARRDGTVVIIGSRGAYCNEFMGIASYAAAKAAVHSYAETLSVELRPFNIRVLLVIPGTFDTAINRPPKLALHLHADYDAARADMDVMLGQLAGMPGKGDPLRGMDVVVDVVKGEGKAGEVMRGGGKWPLWLVLGEDAIRDVKERLARMAEALDAWQEVGSGLTPET